LMIRWISRLLWSDWHWPSWSWIHCLVHRESTMVSDDSCCTEVDYKVLGYSHASWSVNGLQFNLVVHVSTKAHHVSHSTITQLAWTMGAKYHDMSCCLLLVGPDHTTGCHGVTTSRGAPNKSGFLSESSIFGSEFAVMKHNRSYSLYYAMRMVMIRIDEP
jgi:hypothetical protein